MAVNYTPEIEQESPYKEINERIEAMLFQCLLGGKNGDPTIITNLTNFYRDPICEDSYSDDIVGPKVRALDKHVHQLYQANPYPYTKLMVTMFEKSEHTFLPSMFTSYFATTKREDRLEQLHNETYNQKQLATEILNLGYISVESRLLFKTMTKDLSFDDPKCKQIASRICDLYELRMEHLHEGVQTFGPFTQKSVFTKPEFSAYYYNTFEPKNFNKYVNAQIAALGNPQSYYDIDRELEQDKTQ